jgi:NADPH-dependent 2,4-dienoyl-CoA reductase/sulfur reductase-like enzyme
MTATGRRGPIPTGDGAARVVVAGAGFGGLAVVRGLARAGIPTTLIDRNIYATFQPLLYEVATGGLTSSDVAYPLRAVTRRHDAVFRHGELAGIDPAARQVPWPTEARSATTTSSWPPASPPPTTASPGQPNTAWACTPATMPSFCVTGS